MESILGFISPKILSQILVGLSRTVILFIVSSGLSLILGVLRIPNVAHGSLYMIGAFMAYTVSHLFGGGNMGFWMALVLAPLGVAVVSFAAERSLFQFLYEREHLMLLLLTFAMSLVFGDLVKMVWGAEYRSVPVPSVFQGYINLFGGLPFPIYSFFLALKLFRREPAISRFDWHFTPTHTSSPHFSTCVGSGLHSVLPELHPGHG